MKNKSASIKPTVAGSGERVVSVQHFVTDAGVPGTRTITSYGCSWATHIDIVFHGPNSRDSWVLPEGGEVSSPAGASQLES